MYTKNRWSVALIHSPHMDRMPFDSLTLAQDIRLREGRALAESNEAERGRTPDLLHAMQALSQLSYSPNGAAHYREAVGHCQGL